jgi:hypothetical protein
MEEIYAPSDDPVFQLVPPLFEERAQELYSKIGRPTITSDTFWNVYLQLLQEFRSLGNNPAVTQVLAEYQEMTQVVGEEDVQLLPGLRDLRNDDNIVGPHGDLHVGGLREPVIPRPVDQQPAIYYATFTDDEESNGSGSSSDEDFD